MVSKLRMIWKQVSTNDHDAGFTCTPNLTVKRLDESCLAVSAGVKLGMRVATFQGKTLDASSVTWKHLKNLVRNSEKPWRFGFVDGDGAAAEEPSNLSESVGANSGEAADSVSSPSSSAAAPAEKHQHGPVAAVEVEAAVAGDADLDAAALAALDALVEEGTPPISGVGDGGNDGLIGDSAAEQSEGAGDVGANIAKRDVSKLERKLEFDHDADKSASPFSNRDGNTDAIATTAAAVVPPPGFSVDEDWLSAEEASASSSASSAKSGPQVVENADEEQAVSVLQMSPACNTEADDDGTPSEKASGLAATSAESSTGAFPYNP